MAQHYPYYLAVWSTACVVALVFLGVARGSFFILSGGYWRFLFKPWKVGTFVVAATGMTVMAPYTGDPTWDYADAAFMSGLTFATAPWALGVLYQTFRGQAGFRQAYVAACLWLFSASWSYDLYILLRDGLYPGTWASNIVLSSILYGAAGVFWNLDWCEGRGVLLAFTLPEWPIPNPNPVFNRVFWWALPLMILVAAMMAPFLWKYL